MFCIVSLTIFGWLMKKIINSILPLFLLSFVGIAHSQAIEYPHSVTTIVTHSSPGGGSDIFLRTLINYLDEYIDTTFIVENVRGGSSARAIARVAESTPDGSVIYASTPTYILTSLLSNPTITYEDLDPLVNIFFDQEIIYSREDSPYDSLTELINASMNNRVNWGAPNPASLERIALEQLKIVSGANASIITHDGGGELLLNVLNGTLDLGVGEAQELEAQIRSNQIKILAIFSDERTSLLPLIPTVSELGFNIELSKFRGFAVPKNTPPEIAIIFYQAIQNVLNNPEYKAIYEQQLLIPQLLNTIEFGNFIDSFISTTESTFNDLGMR